MTNLPPVNPLACGTEFYTYHYQPQIELATGRLKGFECLARLEHPTWGTLPPALFVKTLSVNGCWQYVWPVLLDKLSIRMHQNPSLRVAINVAPNEICVRGSAFIKHFYQRVLSGKLDPSRIEIEITEDLEITDYRVANRNIDDFNDIGTSVVVDDFGSGFCNTSALARLNVNGVKVDRLLVNELPSSQRIRSIVKSLATIGLDKRFYVLAEGIETQEQWKVALELGCKYGQGFYIGRPAPLPRYKRL